MALRESGRYAKQATATTLAPTRKSLRSTDVTEDLKFVQSAVQEFKVSDKRTGNAALQEARENCQRFEEEMGRLTVDLQEAFLEFGAEISSAYDYRGNEKLWAFFGKFSQGARNRANQNRIQRLLSQTLDKKLAEIQRLNQKVNEDFRNNETRYETDRKEYLERQEKVIRRLAENQPKLTQVIEERTELEEEESRIKKDLETGVVAEDERPAREKELAQLQVNLHDARLDEAELVAIVKSAQEAIKIIEENISAAQKTIISIRNMRVAQAEKHQNLMEIFKNAMTAVIARAAIEQFQVIDPAMNKAATEITRNNVIMAGAAMNTAIERAKKAPIDPETMKELIQQMREYTEGWKQGVKDLEDQISSGPRTIDAELQEELAGMSAGAGR